MAHIKSLEFPFVNGIPKREKSRLGKLWEFFEEVQRVTAQRGTLLPFSFAAELVGVSRQRLHQLAEDGRVDFVEIHGRRLVTQSWVESFARQERKSGRPAKPMKNFRLRAAVSLGIEAGAAANKKI